MNADRWPIEALAGGLRHVVVQLTEAELRLVGTWVERELDEARRPGLRILRTPSGVSPADFAGPFHQLAGQVRKRISELPEDRLIVLSGWVDQQLGRFSVR